MTPPAIPELAEEVAERTAHELEQATLSRLSAWTLPEQRQADWLETLWPRVCDLAKRYPQLAEGIPDGWWRAPAACELLQSLCLQREALDREPATYLSATAQSDFLLRMPQARAALTQAGAGRVFRPFAADEATHRRFAADLAAIEQAGVVVEW